MAKHHETIHEIIHEIHAHGPHHDPAPPPPVVAPPPPPPVVAPPPPPPVVDTSPPPVVTSPPPVADTVPTPVVDTPTPVVDAPHTPPPVVVPPTPTPTPTPTPITTVHATTLVDTMGEYQAGVADLLSHNSAASTVLAQAAFDLSHEYAAYLTGTVGVMAAEDMTFKTLITEIQTLSQIGNTTTAANAAEVNNLAYDIGHITSDPNGPITSLLAVELFNETGNPAALSNQPTGFVTFSTTPPPTIAMEDNAAQWHFVNTLDKGAVAVEANLLTVQNGNTDHLAYTIAQMQSVLDYAKNSVPDASFGATVAPDLARIQTAGTVALTALNDMLSHGGTASPNFAHDQQSLDVARTTIDHTAADLMHNNMPPPNFWLV